LGVISLAFPALGTGVGGFPLDEAARIMVDVTHDELPKSPTIDHLIFALRGVAAYRQFEIALAGDERDNADPSGYAGSGASSATGGAA
jgi:O-acetyl-ADP-ribose deacetylase (regulator of RNase III)